MYHFRASFIQQLDKRPFSFAFGLWGLMQQECGMCLQGSSYCWNMWVLLPGEISEDWDCTGSGSTSWTVPVDVGEGTGLRICSQPCRGNAGEDAPSWISPHPHCSFMLGWPRRVNRSLGWRHGFLLSLHPRWLQVSARLQPVRQSGVSWDEAKLREDWGPLMAPFMSSSWKSTCLCSG